MTRILNYFSHVLTHKVVLMECETGWVRLVIDVHESIWKNPSRVDNFQRSRWWSLCKWAIFVWGDGGGSGRYTLSVMPVLLLVRRILQCERWYYVLPPYCTPELSNSLYNNSDDNNDNNNNITYALQVTLLHAVVYWSKRDLFRNNLF